MKNPLASCYYCNLYVLAVTQKAIDNAPLYYNHDPKESARPTNTLIFIAIQQLEQLQIRKLPKSSKTTNIDESESTCLKVSKFHEKFHQYLFALWQ